MAKTLTIHDPVTDKTYVLEFTRKTVAQLERQGFIAEEVAQKPMSMLPALCAGAFLAHHRFEKAEVIDGIYSRLTKKDELIGKLVEMYNEPILALMTDPEGQEATEGNASWETSW